MPLRVQREAALLSDLALHSKGHWGYDAAFLESCRAELTLGEAELAVRRTCVAEVDGAVVGFGTLEGAPTVGEIGMLFVDPSAIGQGAGRALLAHLVDLAAAAGFARQDSRNAASYPQCPFECSARSESRAASPGRAGRITARGGSRACGSPCRARC
ncbi:MAG: N-acetyltransferase [Actinomycetales bacterium]|nr:MAG: N-acetyltransferase [Actinomycetales bacterium]